MCRGGWGWVIAGQGSSDAAGQRTKAVTGSGSSEEEVVVDPEGEREQLTDHRGGGAPHRVAVQLEERDRPQRIADRPQLLAKHAVEDQLVERDVQDLVDLGG